MMPKPLWFSFMFLSLAFSTANAQPGVSQLQADRGRAEQEKRRALVQKAFGLLNELLGEAQSLKLPENRVRVHAFAADLLWEHDPERARALFVEAGQQLGEMMRSIDVNDPDFYSQINVPAQLRQEMLFMISRRDANLALEFLHATRQPSPPQMDPSRKEADPELQLELSLAGQIADRDPARALRMAEENLEKGLSFEITNVLQQLMAQSPQVAMELAHRLLRRLRAEKLTANREAANVALSLLQMMPRTVPNNPAPGRAPGEQENQAFFLGEDVFREVMDLVTSAVLQVPSGLSGLNFNERDTTQYMLTSLQSMMTQIEKYAPARVNALRAKITQFNNSLDPQTRAYNENQEVMQTGTADDLVAAAGRVPAEIRDQFYQQAAWKAANSGDLARARQIASDHITNPYQRNSLLVGLERTALWNSADQSKVDQVLQLLPRLHSVEERVMTLTQIAMGLAHNNQSLGLELLNLAQSLVGQRTDDSSHFNAQLQIAQAYIRFEPARSFELYEQAIDRLNELVAAAVVVDGFSCQRQFKDGEFVLQGGGPLAGLLEQCGNGLATLAQQDWERAVAVTARLQRTEARLKACLPIIQNLVSQLAGE